MNESRSWRPVRPFAHVGLVSLDLALSTRAPVDLWKVSTLDLPDFSPIHNGTNQHGACFSLETKFSVAQVP